MLHEKGFMPGENTLNHARLVQSKEAVVNFITSNISGYTEAQLDEPIGDAQATLNQFLEQANNGSEWTDPRGFKINIEDGQFMIFINDENKVVGLDKRMLQQKETGLRELFRNSKNPLEVILQDMNSEKIRELVPEPILVAVNQKLSGLVFKDEDEFVRKALEAGQPIWEITQKGKQDLFKQPGREMFTLEDIDQTVKSIQNTNAQRIYVTGNVGSGKSTFARELAGQINFKNIDLDHFFQIYRQEKGQEANLSELLSFVLEREEPPYIINHADLLSHNLSDKADMVVLLNPKEEEQIKSRQIREENNADGEWKNVRVDDYSQIARDNLDRLTNMAGRVVYRNDDSGTQVKSLTK